MSAKNPPHAATTLCAADVLRQLLVGKALIRFQDPISINLYSQPEPDIVVVRVDSRRDFDHHPTVNEIFLLVDADTTLENRTVKARVYVKAEIPEYWILDVN